MTTPEYIKRIFDMGLERMCKNCHNKPSTCDFYLQAMGYYRNKSQSPIYFCGEVCRLEYKNNNLCKNCNYTEVRKIEHLGYSLCTDYPFDRSCYDKFINGENKFICAFCNGESTKEKHVKSLLNMADELFVICQKCYDLYTAIVLHRYTSEYECECCLFCKSDRECYINVAISGETVEEATMMKISVCMKCHDIYKQMVGV